MNENEIQIRLCREADIEVLEKAFSLPGDPAGVHEKRFDRQKEGVSTYLIAWDDNNPVGHLDIRWQGCKNERVKKYITNCPELSAIGVLPEFQSKGIGTELILAAEKIIKEKGINMVGLGVEVGNKRARELYERLGYKDWGEGTFEDVWSRPIEDGEEEIIHEVAIYLTKKI